MQKPSLINLVVAFSMLFVAGGLIPDRISITITPSLRQRIYLLDRYPTRHSIKPNSFVLFSLNTEIMEGFKTNRIIKKVGCTGGDNLQVRERTYYCNGNYMGIAKEYTLEGKELNHFLFEGIIPAGKIFVFSHHLDSYDSKYYGFLEESDVEAIAHPLI